MSRITLHVDPGLGWTKPLVVACCGVCGTELARHRDQTVAARAGEVIRYTVHPRYPSAARRLPGTTSPVTDLALARGPPRRPVRYR